MTLELVLLRSGFNFLLDFSCPMWTLVNHPCPLSLKCTECHGRKRCIKGTFWNLLGYLSIWCQDHLCPNYSQQMFVKLFFNVGFLAPLKTHLSAPSLSVPAELTPFGSGVLQEGFPASAQASLSPRQSQFFPPGARFCSAPRCGWTASPS